MLLRHAWLQTLGLLAFFWLPARVTAAIGVVQDGRAGPAEGAAALGVQVGAGLQVGLGLVSIRALLVLLVLVEVGGRD